MAIRPATQQAIDRAQQEVGPLVADLTSNQAVRFMWEVGVAMRAAMTDDYYTPSIRTPAQTLVRVARQVQATTSLEGIQQSSLPLGNILTAMLRNRIGRRDRYRCVDNYTRTRIQQLLCDCQARQEDWV